LSYLNESGRSGAAMRGRYNSPLKSFRLHFLGAWVQMLMRDMKSAAPYKTYKWLGFDAIYNLSPRALARFIFHYNAWRAVP
jgi:hypothetical protein